MWCCGVMLWYVIRLSGIRSTDWIYLMSEIMFEIAVAAQNKYKRKGVNGDKSYIPQSEWDDYYLEENRRQAEESLADWPSKLEQELEAHARNMDDLRLPTNLGQAITLPGWSLFNACVSPDVEQRTVGPKTGNRCSFSFAGDVDYIFNPTLVLNYSDVDLSLEQRLALLDIKVTCEQGGSEMHKCTLLTNTFFCHLLGDEMLESPGQLSIPLFFFRNFAFPIASTVYHEARILVDPLPADFEATLEYYCIKSPHEIKLELMKPHEYISLQTQCEQLTETRNLSSFNHIVNFLMVRFSSTKASNIYDHISLQPNVSAMELTANELKPAVRYDAESLLEYEFMGIKVYVIPLSPVVMTKDLIAEYISRDNLDMVGVNFSRLDQVELDADIDGELSDYDIHVTAVNCNVMRTMDGQVGMAYSS